MVGNMEIDKVNEFKTICRNYFDAQGLTVHFDRAVSDEIKWRPHIFATDHQQLILDILTQETIPNFYVTKYTEIRNALPEISIYLGLVGDLNYFPDVICECNRNGLGIYKIDATLKLLMEPKNPTVETLAARSEIAIIFGRPYRNILALKICFRKCRTHLYWFERNLPKKVFETVFEAVEEGDIRDVETIRFLRGIDDKVDERFRNEFQSFKQDVHSRGIESQLRIICDSTIANRIHGRYIYSEDEQDRPVSIKLPPINSLKANQWDTILTDVSEIPSFEEFWNNGLDIESSWNEIRPRLEEYRQRRARELADQAEALRSRSTVGGTQEETQNPS